MSFTQVSRRELSWLRSHPDIGNSGLTGLSCLACAPAASHTGCSQSRTRLPFRAGAGGKLFWRQSSPKLGPERHGHHVRVQRASVSLPRWPVLLACHVLSELHGRPTS